MPQICYFCGEEITRKYGTRTESLVFHSLDGNHNNWDPENKVPAHHGHHISYHGKFTTDWERHYGRPVSAMAGSSTMVWHKKFINLGGASAVVIPAIWIKSEELIHHKKMRGVYIELVRISDEGSEDIRISPMWENEE